MKASAEDVFDPLPPYVPLQTLQPPSRPARLLSLDGGGVRGISILYILRQLMQKLDERVDQTVPRPILPCQYFDLIAGTSTGGLIAVMLGTLRMDIETCIAKYSELMKEIFPIENASFRSRFRRLGKAVPGKYRFDERPLESALKRLISEHLGARATNGEDTLFRFEASKDGVSPECKVFVCATTEQLGKGFRFRSYESSWDVEDDCPIWHACRATSALPTIFRPMTIGKEVPVAYVDGGLSYNNPVRSLMDECGNLWPSRTVGCIVSIGTGLPPSRDVGRMPGPPFDFQALATEAEKTAREFSNEMRRTYGANQKLYYRFNVGEDLGNIGFEEWGESGKIQVATRDYLNEVSSQIDACASQLHTPISTSIISPIKF